MMHYLVCIVKGVSSWPYADSDGGHESSDHVCSFTSEVRQGLG